MRGERGIEKKEIAMNYLRSGERHTERYDLHQRRLKLKMDGKKKS